MFPSANIITVCQLRCQTLLILWSKDDFNALVSVYYSVLLKNLIQQETLTLLMSCCYIRDEDDSL